MSLLGDKARRVNELSPIELRIFASELEKIQALAASQLQTSPPITALPSSNPLYFKLSGESNNAPLWDNADLLMYSDSGTTLVNQIANTGVIFNEQGSDINERHEGVGDANLWVLDAGLDRVGIGILSPDGKLHVHSATAGVVAASSTADELVLENSAGGGMSVLVPDGSNARVVLGHVSNSLFSVMQSNYTSGKLEFLVAGNIEINSSVAGGEVVVNQYGNDRDLRVEGSGTPNALFVQGSDGNVGIGLNAPNQPLTVEGTMSLKEQADANADTTAYGQLWVNTATPNELWFTDDAGTDFQLGTAGSFVDESFVVIAATGDLANERVLTGTTNQVVVTDSGAGLAVTLSTPQDLDTAADVQFGSANFSEGNITNVGSIDLDIIRADAANGSVTIELDNSGGADLLVGNNNALVVEGDNDRVGIGTAAPSVELHIVSGGPAILLDDDQGTTSVLRIITINGANYIQSATTYASGNAAPLNFTDMFGANTWMTIQSDGGIFFNSLLGAAASTDVNINGSNELHSVTSSKRFKKLIQPLDKRFDSSLIYVLEPVSFVWKKNTGNPDMVDFGLIAEDAYGILPELVNLDSEGLPYSIRSSMLPVLLLSELQKLNRRVTALETI